MGKAHLSFPRTKSNPQKELKMSKYLKVRKTPALLHRIFEAKQAILDSELECHATLEEIEDIKYLTSEGMLLRCVEEVIFNRKVELRRRKHNIRNAIIKEEYERQQKQNK